MARIATPSAFRRSAGWVRTPPDSHRRRPRATSRIGEDPGRRWSEIVARCGGLATVDLSNSAIDAPTVRPRRACKGAFRRRSAGGRCLLSAGLPDGADAWLDCIPARTGARLQAAEIRATRGACRQTRRRCAACHRAALEPDSRVIQPHPVHRPDRRAGYLTLPSCASTTIRSRAPRRSRRSAHALHVCAQA